MVSMVFAMFSGKLSVFWRNSGIVRVDMYRKVTPRENTSQRYGLRTVAEDGEAIFNRMDGGRKESN